MKLRSALLAATVLALPLAAKAQPVTGLYVGGGVGANWLLNEHVTGTTSNDIGGSGDLRSHVGPQGWLSVGWGFGNGLRAEAEAFYMSNKFYGINAANLSAGGQEQKFGGLVNVLYDFYWLSPWIIPYIGAGVGGGGSYLSNGTIFFDSGPFAGDAAHMSNGTRGAFMYDAIVGAAMPIPAAPGLAVTADFRFLGLAGGNRDYGLSDTLGGTGTATFKNDYNVGFTVGLRYNFGVAPPPAPAPVVAPAPAPARSYLVFFDWDKATLTDRARQIIREAADNSRRVQYTRIEVNGYTDTSGTPRYNMGLSIRRAQAVAAELVRDGVPRNSISIQGFGDTHLLVPTGPGVREPQNRRVEIIIR
jgi:OmpA-OmpF porin, OOP family